MRILMLSKALVSGPYQKKCEELAALPGVDLTVAVPDSWREPRVGTLHLERRFTRGYQLVALPISLNGRHHMHFYPTLGSLVNSLRPEVFHIDEESFNLATFQAMRIGVATGARCCFYNYANIARRYPPPFSLFERYSFRHATHALAANREAEAIIRQHGYRGPLSVIPQFGVDPTLFAPKQESENHMAADPSRQVLVPMLHPEGTRLQHPTLQHAFTLGYLGRLVPEKGLLDLLDALIQLPREIQLRMIGDGSQRAELVARIVALGLIGRVEIRSWASDVPAELHALDALVLPSRTTRNWKEQFGRVLVEAMSCGIPVIGSNSGEIPHVVADAGLIFAEGNIPGLVTQIHKLYSSPALRADLSSRGRLRVLTHYTQAALAQRYYAIYQSMLSDPQS